MRSANIRDLMADPASGRIQVIEVSVYGESQGERGFDRESAD
jgi:hypothetical protein